MRRCNILFLLISCCLLLSVCKKKDSFSEFEGNWKPVTYSYSQGIKSFGTQHNYSVTSQMDYIVSTSYDQQGKIISERSYKLSFSIKTYLKDNSVLVIDEKYQGLDSMGKVVINLSNKNEVSLKEGQTEYGNSTNKQSVKSGRITTYKYDWSGMNFYITNSELVKIQ